MTIEVRLADYTDAADAASVLDLLDLYAREPTGAGRPLAPQVRATLIGALASRPGAFSLLARCGEEDVGLANCFEGFSTFAARPLVNIHDVYIRPEMRGQGVAQALLTAVERAALARGSCAITLEVLAQNGRAKAAYRRAGFGPAGQADGGTEFWKKPLAP